MGLDYTDLLKNISATGVVPDFLSFIFLAVGIYGMNKGIEIDHPVFSLLFSNLIFPFAATFLNLTALFLVNFQSWIRLSLFTNYLSMLFHTTSWGVISILRYISIEHSGWINNKWPEIKKLKPLALAAQFGSFGFLLLINTSAFVALASPYGWPGKSFIKHVPENVQKRLVFVAVVIFIFPILVSATFYFLIIRARSSCFRNKGQKILPEDLASLTLHKVRNLIHD